DVYAFCCLMCVVVFYSVIYFFFFSSRRRHTRFKFDWSSDVCSSDLFCYPDGAGWKLEAKERPAEKKGIVKVNLKLTKIGTVKLRSEERRVGKECRYRWSQ